MTARVPPQYKRDRAYGPAQNWDRFYDECEPLKTCPSSRHTRLITEDLRDTSSPLRRLLIDAGYEPDHWASSIEVTLTCLWEARRYMEWEELPPTKRYKWNGHWVPDASAIEGRRREPAPSQTRARVRQDDAQSISGVNDGTW